MARYLLFLLPAVLSLCGCVETLDGGRTPTATGTSTGTPTATQTITPIITPTPPQLPSAPRNLVAVAGNGQASLSWTAPASDGGSPIDIYVITPTQFPHTLPATVLLGNATGATITGLTDGLQYGFEVQAGTENGLGAGASRFATPAGVPGPVGSLTILRHPDRLTWTVPEITGGVPIAYRITPLVGSTALTAMRATTTTAYLAGLSESRTYRYSVAAFNDASTGPAVLSSSAAIACGGTPGEREYLTPQPVIALAMADLDGDGFPDEVISVNGSVQSLAGRGDGSFQLLQAIGPGTFPVIADFNGDGIPDLAVTTGTSGAAIYQGNGDGTFTALPAAVRISSGTPTAIAAGDFDNDGKMDLVIGTAAGTTLFLGNGDGTFGGGTSVDSGPVAGYGVGDADLDGITDLLVNVVGAENGAVMFGAPTNPLSVVQTRFINGAVVVGLFDEGSYPGIATEEGNGATYLCGSTAPRDFCTGGGGMGGAEFGNQIVIADFNGDGHLDIAASNGYTLVVQLGNGDGTFAPPPNNPAGAFGITGVTVTAGDPQSVLVSADFNHDGIPDLLMTNPAANRVFYFEGHGDGTFDLPQGISGGGNGPLVPAAVAGTFNGHPDVAWVDHSNAELWIAEANTGGVFGLKAPAFFPTGNSPAYLVAGDFNHDGNLDVAVSNQGDGTVSILLGNGDATFQPQQVLSVGSTPATILRGDFNGDGIDDFAVVDSASPFTLSVVFGTTSGSFTVSPVTSNATALVVASFTNSGRSDIATTVAGVPTIFFGNANGTFTPTAITSACAPQLAGDLNLDGMVDLVDVSGGSVRICHGLSSTDFAAPITLAQTGAVTLAQVADLDHDGLPDIVAISALPDVVYLMNDGRGGFETIRALEGTTAFNQLALADFNGDGLLDLAQPSGTSVYFDLNRCRP